MFTTHKQIFNATMDTFMTNYETQKMKNNLSQKSGAPNVWEHVFKTLRTEY